MQYFDDFGWVGATNTANLTVQLGWSNIAGTELLPLALGGRKTWAMASATSVWYNGIGFNGSTQLYGWRVPSATAGLGLQINPLLGADWTVTPGTGQETNYFTLGADGSIELINGLGTIIATLPEDTVDPKAENYIELSTTLSSSSGAWVQRLVLWVNGVKQIDQSNANTGLTTATYPTLRGCGLKFTQLAGNFRWTDFYGTMSSTVAAQGQFSCFTLFPSADAGVTFTPSGETNWQNAAQAPPGANGWYNVNMNGGGDNDLFVCNANPNGFSPTSVAEVTFQFTFIATAQPGYNSLLGYWQNPSGTKNTLGGRYPTTFNPATFRAKPSPTGGWSLASYNLSRFGYRSNAVLFAGLTQVQQLAVIVSGEFELTNIVGPKASLVM